MSNHRFESTNSHIGASPYARLVYEPAYFPVHSVDASRVEQPQLNGMPTTGASAPQPTWRQQPYSSSTSSSPRSTRSWAASTSDGRAGTADACVARCARGATSGAVRKSKTCCLTTRFPVTIGIVAIDSPSDTGGSLRCRGNNSNRDIVSHICAVPAVPIRIRVR